MTSVSQLIDELARLPTEDVMSRVAASARQGQFNVEAIYYLADVMARSGTIVEIRGDRPTADLASTGAPSSLSTLLGPLYLCASGLAVPKLGVPGRPAGGIDVLAQLPGYKYRLSPHEIRDIVARSGYAHFLADASFAPLDAAFFRYRQRMGAQDIPALAAASLLAKKIACGVRYAGLDVRVAAYGNFGRHFGEAAAAARKFCKAARIAGIHAIAILTDARTPYQPYIGRGEALLALNMILTKRADPWLAEHDDRCRLMAAHVVALTDRLEHGRGKDEIGNVFASNIEAQGSSIDAFGAKIDAIAQEHRRELSAPNEGFFRLDIAGLRSVFLAVHVPADAERPFPDKLGLILRTRPGAYVRRGDVLASVRADDAVWPEIREALADAFQIKELLDYAPGVEEIVSA